MNESLIRSAFFLLLLGCLMNEFTIAHMMILAWFLFFFSLGGNYRGERGRESPG